MILYFEMTFEEFCLSIKTINSKQYCEDVYRLGKTHCIGCYYYLYVDNDLQFINPVLKKDRGKKILKSFYSTCSIQDVKEKAYNYIIEYAKENQLI